MLEEVQVCNPDLDLILNEFHQEQLFQYLLVYLVQEDDLEWSLLFQLYKWQYLRDRNHQVDCSLQKNLQLDNGNQQISPRKEI